MKKIITVLTLGLLLSFIMSCTTTKLAYKNKKDLDNGVIKLKNPHYQKRVNTNGKIVGWSSIITGMASTFLLGESLDLIKFKNKEDGSYEEYTGVNGIAWSIPVGIIGYLIYNGIYDSNTKDIPIQKNGIDSWVRDFDNSYKYVDHEEDKQTVDNNINYLTLIPYTSENEYKIKNLDNLSLFVKAFPESNDSKKLFRETADIVSYDKFDELILLSKSKNNIELKYLIKKLLNKEKSFNKVLDLYKENPSYKDEIVIKANSLINSFYRLEEFSKVFGSTKYDDSLFDKFYKDLDLKELKTIISIYPNAKNIIKAKQRYISVQTNYDNIILASKKFPNVYTDQELEEKIAYKVFFKNGWIDYLSKFIKQYPNSKHVNTSIELFSMLPLYSSSEKLRAYAVLYNNFGHNSTKKIVLNFIEKSIDSPSTMKQFLNDFPKNRLTSKIKQKLFMNYKKEFKEYITIANSSISEKSFSNAYDYLDKAEKYVQDNKDRKKLNEIIIFYNSEKKKYDVKLAEERGKERRLEEKRQEYLRNNPSYSWGNLDFFTGWKKHYSDQKIDFTVDIYKNGKYSERLYGFVVSHKKSWSNAAYYSVAVSFKLGHNSYEPKSNSAFIEGSTVYNVSSLNEFLTLAMNALIDKNY